MIKKGFFLLFLLVQVFFFLPATLAQQYSYKPPVLNINFGSQGKGATVNVGHLKNYSQQTYICPNDGEYSFVSYTSDCFNGNWIKVNEDHTEGDNKGNMMVVNASINPGPFFMYGIYDLKPGAFYEISSWMVNICRAGSGCTPTPPVISFTILSNNGEQLAKFRTGNIPPTGNADWLRYYGQFKLPPGISSIVIRFDDETTGGCGNDFAIDDITLREFELPKPEPVKKETPKPANKVPANKAPVKKEQAVPVVILKKNSTVVVKDDINKKPVVIKPAIKERAGKILLPDELLNRSNPLVKQIETTETEVQIDLYDNGEVDGDTVSIYHNGMLVVSNAGLSEKPVSLKIKVDRQQPHHELIMVANNLGSIPPNTSLMIITANGKRYEVFISSSKEKNAKVLVDLKE